ncbi:MAG: hypothetical protein IPK31_10395 [Chitinophagaceae bacterium]|nr:hypothetical protein [Chitinophagaceae bacterium]
MNSQNQSLETLADIKKMMDRSSRFISLSGLSGIAAGSCALVGAWFAKPVIDRGKGTGIRSMSELNNPYDTVGIDMLRSFMGNRLFLIAGLTLAAALVLAFLFTYIRSSKQGIPVWGVMAKRLMWNVALPMIAGGIFLLKLIEAGVFGLIAPGCLIFYGIALVNGAKYTLGEIRYLGYALIILGLVNCWFPGYGLYFWAAGFGVLHIIYGIVMWNKYERKSL